MPCVDGYCCTELCTGQCENCAQPGLEGVCSPVAGSPLGRASCAGAETSCQGFCDGNQRAVCIYPNQTHSCGSPTCAGAIAERYYCDGHGACLPQPGIACTPYGCNQDNTACATRCDNDSECASGAVCDTNTFQCANLERKCDGDFIVTPTSPISCAPYRCNGGVCREECSEPGHCAAGNICTAAGRCAKSDDPAATAAAEDGCSCSLGRSSGGTTHSKQWALVLATVLLLGRRVRRRRPGCRQCAGDGGEEGC